MGWASAGEIFDPVARELIASGASDEVVTRVCTVLIKQLQAGDWDTEDESLGEFTNHPPIVEAFHRCDVYVGICGELWMSPDRRAYEVCRLDEDHRGDHDDRHGHRWPNAKEA